MASAGPWFDEIPGVRLQSEEDGLWFVVTGRATNESNVPLRMDALLSDLLLFPDRQDELW